jgi:hypothetical protein
VAPYTGGEKLFPGINRSDVDRRYRDGASVVTQPADLPVPAGQDLLFVVHADGSLTPVTADQPLAPVPGDTFVLLADRLVRSGR